MEDNNSSTTYQIQKFKFSKFFIIIPICIIVIVLIIFFATKPSPKSIVKSFIHAMQDGNYDKIITYIDFDSMVALSTVYDDIDNFASALEHLNEMSDYENQIHIESIAYTKRYIKATLDEIAKDQVSFIVNNIEVLDVENNDNLNKVIVKLTVEKDNNTKSEKMTFYTMEKDNSYYIIDFDGELYF